MTLEPVRPFQPVLPPGRARALPPVTVALGSLVPALVPLVGPGPLVPPTGLLMLLAWRLLAPASLRLWAPAALGLFDDLVSGQPPGSAMLLWTLAFLAVDFVERRTMFRSFGKDWAIAAALVTAVLVAGRFLASPLRAHVAVMLGTQIVAAALLFPVAARLCAWIDRHRGHA